MKATGLSSVHVKKTKGYIVKDTFNRAVANIRAGINEPSVLAHLPLIFSAVCAGVYAQSEHPVAGLAAAYMVFCRPARISLRWTYASGRGCAKALRRWGLFLQ
ncbi:MAG: hypothetical protein ACXW30_06275 [Micavibrio sp.]